MRCDATRIDGARRWMRDGDEVDDGFFPIDQKPARGFSLSASVWARKNGLESPDDGLAWSVEPDARHANRGCGLRETRRGETRRDRMLFAGRWWCEVRAKTKRRV